METVPSTRVSGSVSCMRFRQRTKVDLPQPEGPMMAVAWFGTMDMVISCSAWVWPNHALSLSTSMPTLISARPLHHATAGVQPYHSDGGHDDNDQHQSSRPGLPVPFVKRGDRVNENL